MPNIHKPSCLNHPLAEGLFKHTTQFLLGLSLLC
ncbi:phosphate transport system permease protein [Actinobacillus equuli]|nr:phosphate transport system permease protein [Actinobacillus equuli]